MATTRLFTVDELEQSPPEGDWELIDGELVPVTPTSLKSTSTALRIGRIAGNFFDDHDLGVMTDADGGFVLFSDRETLLAPDVAFIRKDRVPPEEEQNQFPRLAPDLVVEVLSPTDRTSDVVAKVEMYREAGAPLIWLVDPEVQTVTVIAAGKPTAVLRASDALGGGDVLPSFSIQVAEIFADV